MILIAPSYKVLPPPRAGGIGVRTVTSGRGLVWGGGAFV